MDGQLSWPEGFGPATPEAVASLERDIDRDLPAPYIRFLLTQNGGAPTPGTFRVPDIPSPFEVGMLHALGDLPDYISLRYAMQRQPFLLPDLLPIGYEEGGNPLLLRLDKTQYGSVVLWDEQLDNRHELARPATLYPVAESFDAFLRQLGSS